MRYPKELKEQVLKRMMPPANEPVADLAGRIRDMVETESAMQVRYVPRGRTTLELESVGLVLNCVGPELDYHRIDHPLVRNLMRRGLIRSGSARLGIDALPDGTVIGDRGVAAKVLYTLGSTMKGVLWEVLAVPELWAQAEQLARLLLAAAPERQASGGPSRR